MGPDYCGNCHRLNLPCAQGVVVDGRRCPQAEHACATFEGEAVWAAISRSSGWTGGGMTPRRINRAAVRSRLADIEGWIVEALLDAVEPTALAAAAKGEAARKSKRSGKDQS